MSKHAKGKRSNGNVDSDYCPTPASCARAILSVLPILPDDVVVDVGAGNGVFSAEANRLYGVTPIAVEAFASRYPKLHALREAGIVSRLVAKRYETWLPEPAQRADWTIGNPPFRQAETFLRHALFATKPGGHIALLLRSGFTVTAARTRLFRDDPPAYIYALQTRPTFYVPDSGQSYEDDGDADGDTEGADEVGGADGGGRVNNETDGGRDSEGIGDGRVLEDDGGAVARTAAQPEELEAEPRGKADASEYVVIVWRVGRKGRTLWAPLAWDVRSDIEQAVAAVEADRTDIRAMHWPTYGIRGFRAIARLWEQ
jgi:hypothetical protein